ncbi:MAG: substrate-binding domain-containing protein [Kiritimatiellae bacterium]|nr:substrate-binding domain-containing protein [Kiritimatiellia bacterium]
MQGKRRTHRHIRTAAKAVHQPCKEIAKAAVAAMLQRLRDPTIPPRQILLEAELIVRASTKRKSGS